MARIPCRKVYTCQLEMKDKNSYKFMLNSKSIEVKGMQLRTPLPCPLMKCHVRSI